VETPRAGRSCLFEVEAFGGSLWLPLGFEAIPELAVTGGVFAGDEGDEEVTSAQAVSDGVEGGGTAFRGCRTGGDLPVVCVELDAVYFLSVQPRRAFQSGQLSKKRWKDGTVFKITASGNRRRCTHSAPRLALTARTAPTRRRSWYRPPMGSSTGPGIWGGGSSLCSSGCGTVFSPSEGLAPFVETEPASGQVGAAVTILSTDLTGATRVGFNGIAAVFTVNSTAPLSQPPFQPARPPARSRWSHRTLRFRATCLSGYYRARTTTLGAVGHHEEIVSKKSGT